jgi:hypothetical protein
MVLQFHEGEERKGLTTQLETCSSRLPIDRKHETLMSLKHLNLTVPSLSERENSKLYLMVFTMLIDNLSCQTESIIYILNSDRLSQSRIY